GPNATFTPVPAGTSSPTPTGALTGTPTSTFTPQPTATASPYTTLFRSWTNLTNVTATGNTIQKTGGASSTWDAGAVSSQTILSGDGYAQASVDVTSTYKLFGLSNGDIGATQTDVDFALYMAGGTLKVYE